MGMRTITIFALALAAAACTTTGTGDPVPQTPGQPAPACDAAALQAHIGHKASEKSGAVLLELSGARTLRWVPPRTAVTMDYRPDRLTVSYDDNYVIERISCG